MWANYNIEGFAANTVMIQQRLGHRSLSSATVYAQVNDTQAAQAARSVFMAAFYR